MNGPRKSDRLVVPVKLPNKARKLAAEAVEGRSLAWGNASQQNVHWTQCQESTPSALDRVREATRRNKGAKFTAPLHHVTVDRLRTAFEALKPKAAAGVDGVTWGQYHDGVDEKLVDLHARLHRGAYRAKPTRRAYIPKEGGKERALGIAALEDKIVQRAVTEVMNAIYTRSHNSGCGQRPSCLVRFKLVSHARPSNSYSQQNCIPYSDDSGAVLSW